MIDKTLPAPVKRVIVTVDSDKLPESMIEYAVTIAALLKRPLEGVFIEDTDLLNSAALPFTREICLTTGLLREIDTHRVLSTFQFNMLRFQQCLAQRAEQRSVPWSVSSKRGRRREYQLDSLQEADFCIYSYGADSCQHVQMPGLEKRLLVIDGNDENFYQTLSHLLLPLENQPVHLILVHTDALADDSVLRLLPPATRLEHRNYAELADVLDRMARQLDFVVVSRRHWRSDLAPLLARLPCPLIVIG